MAENPPPIAAAEVARLLVQYRVLLKQAMRRHPRADHHELRAMWEDALCEAYRTHDIARATEATWVNRIFRWRLAQFVARSSRHAFVSLGTDPKVLNGVNPERSFWAESAIGELLKLPPRKQTILVAWLHGYTYAEVAEQVGVSTSRVHQEVVRSLAIIKGRLVLGRNDDGS